jgi:uncharacterized phiE125 gp8 family phage protein
MAIGRPATRRNHQAVLAVSMEAARRAARANGTAMDAEITEKVQGIIEDAEHETGRAFVTQTWRVTLDSFPDAIKLPCPPLVSVEYVKFYDAAGVQQTLDPQDYQVDDKSEPGYVVPAAGTRWPATAPGINRVEVQYVCGYGDSDAAVPAAIKSYILGQLENAYFPNSNAQFLTRLLDRVRTYA